MGDLGREVRLFCQMPTFENWILFCAGGYASATKKDNNQSPGEQQLHQKYFLQCAFQCDFSVRFGWSLLSTYKCCWQATELGFQRLASHRCFTIFRCFPSYSGNFRWFSRSWQMKKFWRRMRWDGFRAPSSWVSFLASCSVLYLQTW